MGTWSDQYVGEGPGGVVSGGGDDKGFDKGGRSRSNSGSPTEDLIGKGVPEDVYITGAPETMGRPSVTIITSHSR